MTGVEGFKAKMEAAGFQDVEEVYNIYIEMLS